MGEFFESLLGWPAGCLHKAGDGVFPAPLLSTPLLIFPFFAPRLLPTSLLPSTFNFSSSRADASSPQLPPADAYILPGSHVHNLLLPSGLGTRLYGHVTYERESVCTDLDSSGAAAQSSSPFFQEQGRGYNCGGIDSLPPYVSPPCQLSKPRNAVRKVNVLCELSQLVFDR